MLLTGFSRCWGLAHQTNLVPITDTFPSAGAAKALETTKQEWPGTNFAAVVEWIPKSRRSKIRNVAVVLGHFGSAMQDSCTSLAESRWKRAKRERLCRLVRGFEGGVCCFLRS